MKRGIVRISLKRLHELMYLPPDVEIRYVYGENGGISVHLVGKQTSGLPEVADGTASPEVEIEVEPAGAIIPLFKRFVSRGAP